MSAIVDGPEEAIKVLMTLHDGFDLLDFAGPLEVLSHTLQDLTDRDSAAFDITIASVNDNLKVQSNQGAMIEANINAKEANERLNEFDIMIVPGGNTDKVVIRGQESEQARIVKAFAELQESDPKRERTLLSVCTGALFLAQAGVLRGLYATTHPDYDVKLEALCQDVAAYTTEHRTEVLTGARYVVNNARFDIADPEDEEAPPNPFIQTREEFLLSKKERRKSIARRGSLSHRLSVSIPENIAARAAKRMGGLRVITAGGVSSGIDATLYLASAYASIEAAEEAARKMQFDWSKGVVVDSVDF